MEFIIRPQSEQIYTPFISNLEKLKEDNLNEKVFPDYVVVGGDGTLNYFLNEKLKSEKANVLYIPDGTANDFARSLKLSDPSRLFESDPKNLIELFENAPYVCCPVMKCNDQLFLNVVTLGAPAEITESGSSLIKKVLGQWSYYLSALEKIFDKEPLRARVYTDEIKDESIITGAGHVIGQGLFAGGGVRVSDKLSPMFKEYYFATLALNDDLPKVLSDILKIQNGGLEEDSIINSYKLKEDMCISFDKEITLKVDGELNKAREVRIGKTKKIINFLVY